MGGTTEAVTGLATERVGSLVGGYGGMLLTSEISSRRSYILGEVSIGRR